MWRRTDTRSCRQSERQRTRNTHTQIDRHKRQANKQREKETKGKVKECRFFLYFQGEGGKEEGTLSSPGILSLALSDLNSWKAWGSGADVCIFTSTLLPPLSPCFLSCAAIFSFSFYLCLSFHLSFFLFLLHLPPSVFVFT